MATMYHYYNNYVSIYNYSGNYSGDYSNYNGCVLLLLWYLL
jgi:hypothetical protein